MKVTVIGSGSMWSEYNSACYMIDNNIMVDYPNGACKYLYRLGLKPKSIEHLLITHFHGDHYFDVPFLIYNKGKQDSKRLTIYSSKDGKKKIFKLGLLAFPHSFFEVVLKSKLSFNYSEEFTIGKYNITKVLMDHGRMKPAYGYLIENKKRKIGFTGDSSLCEGYEYLASKCDYLFCDCTHIEGNNHHTGINNILYLAKKYHKCKFVVSHLDNKTRKEFQKIKAKNIIIPKDGMEIKI